MSFEDKIFDKNNLDFYLRELAREFRKLNGKTMRAEMILIGGASVLLNYGFRDMTYDIDAIIISSSAMKQAVNNVGDRLDLPNGWLNTDFMKTKSYSSKLREHSVYYKTFSNILTVRTVTAEYLIAMKLMAGRPYKNDLSDILGILNWHKENDVPVTYERIQSAVKELYGEWAVLPEASRKFIEKALKEDNYVQVFDEIRNSEKKNKAVLKNFEETYPGVLSEDNLADILHKANEKLEDHHDE